MKKRWNGSGAAAQKAVAKARAAAPANPAAAIARHRLRTKLSPAKADSRAYQLHRARQLLAGRDAGSVAAQEVGEKTSPDPSPDIPDIVALQLQAARFQEELAKTRQENEILRTPTGPSQACCLPSRVFA